MATITITNLSFGWEGSADDVFDDVSFRFDTDWKLGLIGRNGRGKTTLLRLLTDPKTHPYSGTISSPVNFKYFPYDVKDTSINTLDVIDSVCPNYEFWELCREMNLLGVPEDALFRPFDTLSPGERTKTLLATLFLGESDFVLLDEPTNHLDAEGKRFVTEYLRSKKGFLIVSHDRDLLDTLCDHIVSIGTIGVDVMSGNYSVWAEERFHKQKREEAENEQLKKDVRRLKDAARRTENWSDKVEKSKFGTKIPDRGFVGHKSAKMMKRSKAIEARRDAAIEQKSKLLQDIEKVGDLKLTTLNHHSRILIEASDISIDYLPDLSPLSMKVEQGERVALLGANGSGKSSIIKLIAGENIPHSGTIKTTGGLVTSYIPQDSSDLRGNIREFAQAASADLTLFLTILRNLGLEREAFDKNIEDFSDGQKRKALIARSLCIPAHVYIWDEPLNYIDILSREQIEDLLITYSPTMIFVEHDETFVRKIASRTIIIE